MRIIGLTTKNSGVGYHRLMLPLYYMPKEYAYFTDMLSDETLNDNFDILIINRMLYNKELEEVLHYKNKYNLKLVIDIDDHWILDPFHVLAADYPTQKVIDHIKAADLVTVTNELLWKECKALNSNVEILPNALPYGEDQYINKRVHTDRIKFVHTGSITHEKDIEILRGPMQRVYSDKQLRDRSHFTLCGFNDANERTVHIWSRMISDYTCALKLSSSIKKHLPVTEYMNFYSDADCSIVPLLATRFNSMKSNLKILEAAATRIPVICSNVAPYDTAPHAIKISRQPEWYQAIKKIASDAIYRKEIGEANFQWCNEHYNLHKINQARRELYASLLNHSG